MAQLRLVVLVAVASLVARPAVATIADPAFAESVLVNHPELTGATGFAWAPDGSNRLFVALQAGGIRVVKDGALLPAPFATVSPLLVQGENGLIGIAFDPNFAVSQHLYVFATVESSAQQVIRYTAAGDVGTEKTTILGKLPSGGFAHSGGALAIGPDGKIYFGIGDTVSPALADDRTTLAGKIGRANLDGTAVSDNPFVDGPEGRNDHVFALGLRNPFSMAFQPATGLLWVSSVGWIYEQIFIVKKGDHAGWGPLMYEIKQPAGFIRPVYKYATNAPDYRAIVPAAMNGAVRTAGVATFTTAVVHNFTLGEKINIVAPADPSFATSGFIASIPSPTTFTMAQPGPDAVSGGGHAYTAAPGGCVVAGAFYEVAGAPAAYRGNYFFGDYTSGLVHRMAIDPASNVITSVVEFARMPGGHVDTELGPDGALYFIGHADGGITRVAPVPAAQGLIVTPAHVMATEGQPRVVTVRLQQAPAQPVTVSVARASGDAEIAVTAGASLTFDAQNFARPQRVTIAAGHDLDATDERASFSFAAAGLPSETVQVAVRDDNALALQASARTLMLDEGATASLSVVLTAQPSLDVVVTVARASGDADVSGASGPLTFTRASWATPQMVTVAAARDGDGADDRATVEIAAPGLPAVAVEVAVRDNYVAPDVAPDAPVVVDAGAELETGPPDPGARDADPTDPRPEAAGPVEPSNPTDARPSDGARAAVSDDGCGCRLGRGQPPRSGAALLLLLALAVALNRRGPAAPGRAATGGSRSRGSR